MTTPASLSLTHTHTPPLRLPLSAPSVHLSLLRACVWESGFVWDVQFEGERENLSFFCAFQDTEVGQQQWRVYFLLGGMPLKMYSTLSVAVKHFANKWFTKQ